MLLTSIGDLLVHMCIHPHVDSQLITSDIVTPTQNKEQLKTTIAESKNIIEMRYTYEKQLTNAISRGDKEEIARISQEK